MHSARFYPSGQVLTIVCKAGGSLGSLNLWGLSPALSCPSWASGPAQTRGRPSAPSWCGPACSSVPCLLRGGGWIGDQDGQILPFTRTPGDTAHCPSSRCLQLLTLNTRVYEFTGFAEWRQRPFIPCHSRIRRSTPAGAVLSSVPGYPGNSPQEGGEPLTCPFSSSLQGHESAPCPSEDD